MIWLLAGAVALSMIPAGLRWLRVAQREHYLAPAVSVFSARWWLSSPTNLVLGAVSLAGVIGSWFDPGLGILAALAQVGPIGLSVRGRTSALAWTGRMRRLAIASGVLALALVVVGAMVDFAPLVVAPVVLFPLLVDLTLAGLGPIERRVGERWVGKAADRLAEVAPRVVAITGSYGKTTTKQYVHHLLAGQLRVVSSPASFNNRMGLARSINEHLVPGTDVFVAEMGTYGPGEIAELCRWIKPTVAALVAIGPVHLERFRSEERIVEAKSEILDRAEVGVIAIDHPLLAELAEARAHDLEVLRVSATGIPADVTIDEGVIRVEGSDLGSVPAGVFPINLAVAVAIVRALGVSVRPEMFETLPHAEHRQSESMSAAGVRIIDDTFNSNPAGAATALASLAATDGKKFLVTPGMVELGPLQAEENQRFAEAAAAICDEIIVVGSTNRKALLRGAASGGASVTVVPDRAAAVELVRARLGDGDAVLYENDLPDHYP